MENSSNNELWSILDKLRGIVSQKGLKLLEAIGIFHGDKRLNEIVKNQEIIKLLDESYAINPPIYIYKFLEKLINIFSPETTFDPWITIASPTLMLSLKGVDGICRFPFEYEKVKRFYPDLTGKFVLGDLVNHPLKIRAKNDLVCCFSPFGMREPNFDKTKESNDYTTLLILKCIDLIPDNGRMIFLLAPSFFHNLNSKDLILKSGLNIDAVFTIPSGAFLPETNITSNIVVFSKIKSEKTFVAEITENDKTNHLILENYKNRKAGKVIQLGSLVDINTYKSLRSIIFDHEFNELVKRIGFPPISLTDIALKINALKEEIPDDIEHLPNSIYLPKIGNSPAVSSPSNMKIKPKNYYQIQLNEEKANANYVANYFNTEIGKKLRLSLEVGSVIMQIPKSQLKSCVLHLPDISTQSELINLDNKIEQIATKLLELKTKLWKQPKNYSAVNKELKAINQEDKLESWIDTLPFPISSILWRYYATKEVERKVEHLFHFFEAFSEFLSMIMLSALVQETEFYQKECHRWIEKEQQFKDWYMRATFGSWNILTSRLSKAVREYISDKEKSDICRTFLGNPNDSFLNIITSKGIVRILTEVGDYRNKWKGHGGITSDEENKRRLVILQQQLTELRKFISDGFEETRIYAPTTSSYEGGLFSYFAKELVGARTPFNEVSIETLIPLDRKKLYLVHSGQTKPIELLPFIKYYEEKDAVYFYMSVESKDIRWVSYHYDKEPELLQPADNEIFKALDYLKEKE